MKGLYCILDLCPLILLICYQKYFILAKRADPYDYEMPHSAMSGLH